MIFLRLGKLALTIVILFVMVCVTAISVREP